VTAAGKHIGSEHDIAFGCHFVCELFGFLVQPRRLNGLETQRLKNVKITDEKIKLANQGMTSTSARCHDESAAINRAAPTTGEAEANLKKYEEFLTLCPAN
jgi:hypothetical protein